jgi:hypothetical protein
MLRLLIFMAAATVLAGSAVGETPARTDFARLSPDAARMYSIVQTPRGAELKWQLIPWLVDLDAGIRAARAENRPLLLFVSGDDPLEKC